MVVMAAHQAGKIPAHLAQPRVAPRVVSARLVPARVVCGLGRLGDIRGRGLCRCGLLGNIRGWGRCGLRGYGLCRCGLRGVIRGGAPDAGAPGFNFLKWRPTRHVADRGNCGFDSVLLVWTRFHPPARPSIRPSVRLSCPSCPSCLACPLRPPRTLTVAVPASTPGPGNDMGLTWG